MRHTGPRIASSDIHHPFVDDCRIEHAFTPEGLGYVRVTVTDPPQVRVRNLEDRGRCNRLQVRHGLRENDRLQVDHIPGHEDGCNLSIAISVLTEGADHALKDEAAVADSFA